MRRVLAAVAVTALAVLPSTARAACVAGVPPEPVDLIARPLPGPSVPGGSLLSPAAFSAVLYQAGSGPEQLEVTTGATLLPSGIYALVSEGLFPHPGELWRLRGSFDAAGVLQAGVCTGSREITDPPAVPAISIPGRTIRPSGATLAGLTHVQPPTVRIASRMLTLRSSVPLVAVRSAAGADGIGASTLWRVSVPGGASRVVVDTGDRVYAFGVFSRLAHR